MRGSNSESDKIPPSKKKIQPGRRVLGALSPWVKQPGREADHLHLVPKFRMIESDFSSESLHGMDGEILPSGSIVAGVSGKL